MAKKITKPKIPSIPKLKTKLIENLEGIKRDLILKTQSIRNTIKTSYGETYYEKLIKIKVLESVNGKLKKEELSKELLSLQKITKLSSSQILSKEKTVLIQTFKNNTSVSKETLKDLRKLNTSTFKSLLQSDFLENVAIIKSIEERIKTGKYNQFKDIDEFLQHYINKAKMN